MACPLAKRLFWELSLEVVWLTGCGGYIRFSFYLLPNN